MKRSDLIQKIVDVIKARTYLEIGISGGKNFFRIKAKYKSAVDPNFAFSRLADSNGFLRIPII